MATIPRPIPSDIAFTPTVKAFQQRKGSRHAYARMEQSRGCLLYTSPSPRD